MKFSRQGEAFGDGEVPGDDRSTGAGECLGHHDDEPSFPRRRSSPEPDGLLRYRRLERGRAGLCSGTVSYTHLTLPTTPYV